MPLSISGATVPSLNTNDMNKFSLRTLEPQFSSKEISPIMNYNKQDSDKLLFDILRNSDETENL